MNRLQKKCLIATAGSHFLLVLILFVGPGFFTSEPKRDETKMIDVIPATLVDAAVSSGVKNAPPPSPTPAVQPPPPQPVVQPPPPEPTVQPEVKPPVLEKTPDPEPVKPSVKPIRDEPKVPEKTKPAPVKPAKISLKPVVRNQMTKPAENTDAENEAREAKAAAKRLAAKFANAAQAIEANSSSSTSIDMPGESSASYANYASAVKSKYEAAWTEPEDATNENANTKVSVTISRDGSVISARIITRSGDAAVDRSVQRTLDRVTFVAPFPDGAKDKERTFIINFNLKAKRMLG